jgi:diacylglycerol kinase
MSTLRHAFRAVFWSFFGIRKSAEYEKDTQRLKPQHVIAAGVIAAVAFVVALYGVVKLVTR